MAGTINYLSDVDEDVMTRPLYTEATRTPLHSYLFFTFQLSALN